MSINGASLDHVDVWLFDLDNTLYPASCRLFDQIELRMGAFITDFLDCDAAAARRVQKGLFHRYGTTMRGLMTEHGLDPEVFLAFVHDIDYGPVPAMPGLDAALAGLSSYMSGDHVVIHVSLGLGAKSATVWGCDLSDTYVRFNADYTT